jgi:glycosyltransferase involved in cell wall biosynthesis
MDRKPDMTARKKLIVMPLGLRIDWSADYEYQTAVALAKRNVVILFAIGEGGSIRQYLQRPFPILRRIHAGLYLYRPIYLLPFQRISFIRRLNAQIASRTLRLFIMLCDQWRKLPKLYWSFSLQKEILPYYFGKGYFAIYDCVDDIPSSKRNKPVPQFVHEQQTIAQSQLVLTNSSTLYALHKRNHPWVVKTEEGLFALDVFSSLPRTPVPVDMRPIPKPRVVFIGNINNRLDFPLIERMARNMPDISYVFIGGEDPQYVGRNGAPLDQGLTRLKILPNIYFLGKKPKHMMPAYVSATDIGFIPYDTRDTFNMRSYPMKISEYFYYGIPVLSTALPEVKKLYPFARTFASASEGARIIHTLLSSRWPASSKKAQRRIAKANAISTKIARVETLLHAYFPERF